MNESLAWSNRSISDSDENMSRRPAGGFEFEIRFAPTGSGTHGTQYI
jgi:hypothetical protein